MLLVDFEVKSDVDIQADVLWWLEKQNTNIQDTDRSSLSFFPESGTSA